MKKMLIGPFTQLLTMAGIPIKGAIADDNFPVLENGGLLIQDGQIEAVARFNDLKPYVDSKEIIYIDEPSVCLPAYIDCHTHIAFGGSREKDFALRNAGSSYLEIANAGGGIWDTVNSTRKLSLESIVTSIIGRNKHLLAQGIATIEVKSGYGLSVEEEYKILKSIQLAGQQTELDIISTCLAAHTIPKEYNGNAALYLDDVVTRLFPLIKKENLTTRIDAFIEKSAFSVAQIEPYFDAAQKYGFDITVHADQFTTSGAELAVRYNALSADHLEASGDREIDILSRSNTVAVALPAASLGMGCKFTPARKLLDAGACVAIATDWNPGSAPLGQLVASASILATMEKLTNAEILSAITFRAAHALGLKDRGRLVKGQLADFSIYPTANYQNVTYYQGGLQPNAVWKKGKQIYKQTNYDNTGI